MRLYRKRASEFELLAETEPLHEARLRYQIVARHYSELADREEQSDKARMAKHLELLRLERRQAAESFAVGSDALIYSHLSFLARSYEYTQRFTDFSDEVTRQADRLP